MKVLIYPFIFLILFFSCKYSSSHNKEKNTESEIFLGKKITKSDALDAKDFFNVFNTSDSIHMKIKGTINEVCAKKGCWMTMPIGEDQELLVRFKDYGFFVPLNSSGSQVVIEGWAYKEVIEVGELKHYAFDAGKTQEQIDSITEPEISYSFIAEGLILN